MIIKDYNGIKYTWRVKDTDKMIVEVAVYPKDTVEYDEKIKPISQQEFLFKDKLMTKLSEDIFAYLDAVDRN